MLAFQTMNTKRRREDDSDSEDERYLKKSRPWAIQHNNGSQQYPSPSNLPLRPSVTPSPPQGVPGLEAMTPAQSEHSETNSPASIQDEPLFLSSQHNSMDYDMQMDEDDLDIVGSQPPDSPFITTNFRPAKLNADLFSRDSPNNITGRIPTPIYPNFHTGGMNGLGYPSSGLAGGMSMSNGFLGVPSHQPPIMQPPPRKQNSQGDQDRSRRMPSPISEDEDIPDTPTALTQSQLERLSVTSHVGSSDRMDADMAPPLVPSPPARGRKRSGALTGMGRFSMGYRDDCEKCRQRVPGHYSHFLP